MKSKEIVRVLGVRKAADEAGVSPCHISLVARGLRHGSRTVKTAVQRNCKVIYAEEETTKGAVANG